MRRIVWLAIACFALLSAPCTVRASEGAPPLDAHLVCAPAAGPGRVLCDLSARTAHGTLVWSDALVVRAPSFAKPLRSRVAAEWTEVPGSARARLALVASESGEGDLQVLARGVICEESNAVVTCRAVKAVVSATVSVASPRGAP